MIMSVFGCIARLQLGIESVGWAEAGDTDVVQVVLVESVPNHVDGATVVDHLRHPLHQHGAPAGGP